MTLEVRFKKRLGNDFLLDVDFTLSAAALGILGPSGCGKSMTLRCIAGVETPDSGRIVANGRILFDSEHKVNVKPQKRRVGMLFQNYALFPHISIADNVAMGVSLPTREKARSVRAWLDRMRIAELAQRLPSQLSGGQQQRAALARMLAAKPDLILLDEPFSALDHHLREQMQLEVREIMRERREVIMVTHSRDEVYRLCDRLLVMEQGRVLGNGDCRELFRNPGTRRIADLTGCKNFSRAERHGPRLLYAADWDLELVTAQKIGDDVAQVGIRAHDMVPAFGREENVVTIAIQEKTEDPFEWNVIFTNAESANGKPVWWKFSKYLGSDVPERLSLPPEALLLLRED